MEQTKPPRHYVGCPVILISPPLPQIQYCMPHGCTSLLPQRYTRISVVVPEALWKIKLPSSAMWVALSVQRRKNRYHVESAFVLPSPRGNISFLEAVAHNQPSNIKKTKKDIKCKSIKSERENRVRGVKRYGGSGAFLAFADNTWCVYTISTSFRKC